MAEQSPIRPGEVAVELPPKTDAGLFFIGTIHTPWTRREDCPRQGSADGPVCTIAIDERWREGLTGLADQKRLQVLYWMNRARRDLVLQAPFQRPIRGTFALRSPLRPNPIASSVVELVAVDGLNVKVRGLDCLDGTPLLDLKPEHGAHQS